MQRRVAVVVEGHGEKESVPILLRRIYDSAHGLCLPVVGKHDVIRVPRSKLVRDDGDLARTVELAARRAGADGAVLILVDADDALPCVLGPQLLARAVEQRKDMRIGVVVANHEYEAWFVASAESLGIGTAESQAAAESRRGAKEVVKTGLGRYSPVLDQPKLTARMNLESVRRHSPSFDKMWREVCRLLKAD